MTENIHPDCEDRCQLKEHKGYNTCERSGECQINSFYCEAEQFRSYLKCPKQCADCRRIERVEG